MNPDWTEMRQLDGQGFIADSKGPNPSWMDQYIHPDDQPEVLKAIQDAIRNKVAFELEHRVRRVDGTLGWTQSRAVPILDDSGEIIEWFGAASDVSDRKQQQLASLRLSAIVSSSDDAIISKDLNGIVTSWNAAAQRIFGYTPEEMIGQPITKIIPPELQDDEKEILKTIARGERIEHFETVRVTKGGERIEVSLTVSPVKDGAGRIVGAAKIARDITQRRKAERALNTAEKLASVGRLAATVAHEINNPLEALTNLIYLAKSAAAREDVRSYLTGAEEELARVSQLTKQTLGFYRETKGIIRIRVGSMVNSLLSVFASRTRNKAIEIHTEIEEDPEINAVPGEIRQLIANLVSNSIDAVARRGRIRIRVRRSKEWSGKQRDGVRLTVADNGCGILAAAHEQLFQPFFTTKREIGTGLGLWVCKSIVEKHHGAIRVKSSTAPGKSGTVFTVFLPLDTQLAIADGELHQAV
jgi:PAS domain S-box-containing protein